MTFRAKIIEPELAHWQTTGITSTIQDDGFSCGVFVSMVS